jgi:hypothetical protein
LLYGTHSQLHSMQSSCRVGDQGHLWQKQVVLCIMDDGPHFAVLSEPRPTQPGLLFGVQSQNGLCGGYILCWVKKPEGGVLYGNKRPVRWSQVQAQIWYSSVPRALDGIKIAWI